MTSKAKTEKASNVKPAIYADLKASHQKELKRLERALKSRSGFQLVLLQFNEPLYRDKLIERINDFKKSTTVLHLDISEFPTFHSFEEKIEALGREYKVIHLVGLEDWLMPKDMPSMITGFNYHREAIAEGCPSALLLWMTEPALDTFAVNAPDMWAWRSAVLDFNVEKPAISLEPAREVAPLASLPIEVKQARIKEVLEYVEQRPEDMPDRIYAGLLNELGILHESIGEFRSAIAYHEKALKTSKELHDEKGEGAILGNMGNAYQDLGKYQKAIGLYGQALEIAKKIGDMQGEGNALGNMGNAYANLGEYRKAMELYEQALEIDRKIGDVRGEGVDLGNMGSAYMQLGEYRKAIGLYEKRLEIAKKIGDMQGEGKTLGNMGIAYQYLGDNRKAIGLFEQSLEISKKIGDVQGEGADLGNMGSAYINLGEYRKAIGLYAQQLEITRRIGDVRGEGNALANMGVAYAALGEREKALESLDASIGIFKKLGLPHMVEKVEGMKKGLG